MSEPHGVGGDVVRSEAVVGELGWCVGVRWGVFGIGEWVGLSGGGGDGGGGGGFCKQQVAVQCVVRVAAKHWASGLQGTVEGTAGRGKGGR